MLTRIIECEPSANAGERDVDEVSIVLTVPLHAPPYRGQHFYAGCEQLNPPDCQQVVRLIVDIL